jgi:hypothetical protein
MEVNNMKNNKFSYFKNVVSKGNYLKRRWYFNSKNYLGLNKYNLKLMENFLHWIKGEPQTDIKGNIIPHEQLTIKIDLRGK